jgi:hypothetical protein
VDEIEEYNPPPITLRFDYSWTSATIKSEQDNDNAISRVRVWVEMGHKPFPNEL